MNENEIMAVISELNRIEVHGDKNLDILLGCISFMKSKVKEIERIKKECLKNAKPEIEFNSEGVVNNG